MSLPSYPEYKDSGVAWLGDVPGHWTMKRLKHCLSPLTEKAETSGNKIALENIESWSGNHLPTDSEFEGDGIAFATGDILFGKLRPYLAKAYLAESSGEAVGDFHVMRPGLHVSPRFAQYQILNRDFIALVDGSTFGSKMPRASWEFVGNMPFPLPEKSEQIAIAAFLDRETAKIDALVAEQEKLIALLAEKRQATISHAVTKGLNPGAPMKDSGVAWLGEVPAHWNVAPLGIICSLIQTGPFGSQLHAEDYVEDGTPVVNPSNLVDGQIVPDWKCSVAAEMVNSLPQHVLRIGDIVFGRRGEMGRCALVKPDNAGWLCGTGSLNLRLKTGNPKFVVTYLGTPIVRELLKLESVGSTMDNLNAGILSRIRVPLPPDAEQQEISVFLDSECTRLDALTAEATRGVSLLKERRSALISAAVTGKIDVRHLNEAKAA